MNAANKISTSFGGWENPGVHTLEQVMHRDAGDAFRGQELTRFYEQTQGNLQAAASSIVSARSPVIRILTGFYIESAKAAETDGILAAAQMTKFFKLAGIDCCITTDQYCAAICRAALAEVGCSDRLEVVPDSEASTIGDYIQNWVISGVTHTIAIERPGPSLSDDKPYNMMGEEVIHCAPLHLLFNGGDWKKIGIIDRGNEIGSGSLPGNVIAEDILNGGKIACRTGADYLLVSRVSNWAANALTSAVALLGPNDWTEHLNVALSTQLLEKTLASMVRAGSVDGITRVGAVDKLTVDALPLADHIKITKSFRSVVDVTVRGRNLLQKVSRGKTTKPLGSLDRRGDLVSTGSKRAYVKNHTIV